MTRVAPRAVAVVIRPYRSEDVDLVDEAVHSEDAAEWLPLGPPPRQELHRRVDAGGRLSDGRIDLVIEADGRLVGEIDARHPRLALPPGVWEIGVTVFARSDRGRGVGRAALRLMCERLFGEEGASRVQLTTDVDNRAMRSAAERVGFRMEGVLKSFMPSGGERRDYALYAIAKEDWEPPPGSPN